MKKYYNMLLNTYEKKYIEIERINPSSDWDFKNVKIVLKENKPRNLHPDLKFVQSSINDFYNDIKDTREPLSKSEELYLNLLKRYAMNSEISMKNFQKAQSYRVGLFMVY